MSRHKLYRARGDAKVGVGDPIKYVGSDHLANGVMRLITATGDGQGYRRKTHEE